MPALLLPIIEVWHRGGCLERMESIDHGRLSSTKSILFRNDREIRMASKHPNDGISLNPFMLALNSSDRHSEDARCQAHYCVSKYSSTREILNTTKRLSNHQPEVYTQGLSQ